MGNMAADNAAGKRINSLLEQAVLLRSVEL